jgi:hypothetical protein
MTRKPPEAFLCETRLCFFAGFFQQRRKLFRASHNGSMLCDFASFLYSLMRSHNVDRVRE